MSEGKDDRQSADECDDDKELATQKNDSDEATDGGQYLAKPPDGGWGWVIVLASFMNHFILDGIAYAFGVFMQDYRDFFGSTKAQTSALMSTLIGFYMLTAPVASGLINRFGLRAVGIAGSAIAGSAFVLCTFSPNIECMIFLFGVIGGLGFGLMYMPAVVSVGYYFDKKRAIATGIAMCGTGVGTLTFGPLGTYLLDVFDWKNAHYILAAIILNGVVFSSLIRPLHAHGAAKSVKTKKKQKKVAITTAEASTNTDRPKVPLLLVTDEQNGHLAVTDPNYSHFRSTPLLALAGSGQAGKGNSIAFAKSATTLNADNAFGSTRGARLSASDINRPMYRKDIFYSGSIRQLHETSAMQSDQTGPSVAHYATSANNVRHTVHLEERPSSGCCSCLPKDIADVLSNMLDLSLFRDANFVVISVACLFSMVAYLIPFGFTNVRAESLGVDKDKAALLVSLLGITNMLGRVASSGVAQIPRLKALLVHNVSLGISSLFIIITPFCTTYATIAACASGYGFFIGGHASLCPIFLCDLLGLEKLTTAYGLLTLVRGIAVLIGPPMAGAISDMTGDYDLAFYMGGTMMAISTLFFCTLHLPYFTSRSKQAVTSAEQQ